MENYICASVCILILSLFGCLDGIFEKMRIDRMDIAYAALCVIALSAFRYKPIAEFDVDVAVFVLPAFFALLSAIREEAAGLFARFSLVCTLPIAVSAAIMLYELTMTTYAYFSLRARTICLAQFALCAIALMLSSFRTAMKKAV